MRIRDLNYTYEKKIGLYCVLSLILFCRYKILFLKSVREYTKRFFFFLQKFNSIWLLKILFHLYIVLTLLFVLPLIL